eukprot:CAMPEP_0197524956 /NCGR_PEP_ID=MMETSP1318-20131121/10480_1 /TAXON_ID=552666 /ORGANISM="Partenskyella glossopodia, Strain RCC365" /LENGTH=225 /DNA_ID=CAMNT_0043078065 /DNA_START=28 /DNA_END=705 /DNA_ORIENTATION=-
MSDSKRCFEADTIAGNPRYKTYDNDRIIGVDAPSLEAMEWLTDVKTYPKPKEGQPIVLFVWAQFQKACYPKVVLYSKLQKFFGDKICVIGVSTDPDNSYATKWIEDPKKKYSCAFETSFAITFDVDRKIKTYLTEKMRTPLSVPHCFVISGGKIVWHQQHSELGATAPMYMNLMEDQLNLILAGKEVKKVHGENPIPQGDGGDDDDDDDEDEEEEEEEDDGFGDD